MNSFSHVPPGFRFHPTDEELVDYYLRKKIASKRIDLDVIKDVDLYKIEPWDLQELCRIGSEEQNDWYFFSHKDKKYPTGTRTNRATRAGFWKATGRDKAIYIKNCLIGMRKTLVFYKGRAPNGQKSDWIMHEYRLETCENGNPHQEEGWVVCRVFKKRITSVVSRREGEHDGLCWYDDHVVSFMPDFDSPARRLCQQQPYNSSPYHHHQYSCKQELDNNNNSNLHQYNLHHHHDAFLQLPQLLESPKVLPNHQSTTNNNNNASCSSSVVIPSLTQDEQNQLQNVLFSNQQQQAAVLDDDGDDQVTTTTCTTDWRVLDRFVASQLSHDPNNNSNDNNIASKETTCGNHSNGAEDHLNMTTQDMTSSELASVSATSSTTTSQMDHMWK